MMDDRENQRRFRPRRYRYGACFMERGGLYGRGPKYPWRAYRSRNVFSTCVHLRLDRWTFDSANALAFERQEMDPVLAYQCRSRPLPHQNPPAVESLPIEWREVA